MRADFPLAPEVTVLEASGPQRVNLHISYPFDGNAPLTHVRTVDLSSACSHARVCVCWQFTFEMAAWPLSPPASFDSLGSPLLGPLAAFTASTAIPQVLLVPATEIELDVPHDAVLSIRAHNTLGAGRPLNFSVSVTCPVGTWKRGSLHSGRHGDCVPCPSNSGSRVNNGTLGQRECFCLQPAYGPRGAFQLFSSAFRSPLHCHFCFLQAGHALVSSPQLV